MSGVRSIYRGATLKGYATPAGAPIYVDSDDNLLKVNPYGSGTTEVIVSTGTTPSLTPVVAFTLTTAQSGTNVFLGPTAGFEITLPAVAAGLNYRFIVADQFATSDYVIATPGDANIIFGGAIVNSVFVVADVEDAINFVASAEQEGDFVELWSNGTYWFVSGVGAGAGSITFTT